MRGRCAAVGSLLLVAAASLSWARATDDGVRLAYARDLERGDVASEWSLSLAIEGTDQMVGFVRSLHPFLSLDRLHVEAQGKQGVEDGRHKLENDDARTEGSYDDERFLFDFKKGELAPDLGTNKLEQLMMAISSGRDFTLSPRGVYRSADPNQEHVGEALDHFLLGVTRLPEKPVNLGEVFTVTWKGERNEKGKHGQFAFEQKTKVESLETRASSTLVTLASSLAGTLEVPEAERDKTAEEAWTRCEGRTRIVLEEPSGRIVSSGGKGTVVAYYRGSAADGSRNEVRITFVAQGKEEFGEPREKRSTHWR
jgi:hypothetical protein